jgi:hypothetical protein
VCAGVITLLVIIYKGYSPSLVRARSQDELEVVFAGALCYTGLTGASYEASARQVWPVTTTGLTGGHCELMFSGTKNWSWSSRPFTPPLGDIKVLSSFKQGTKQRCLVVVLNSFKHFCFRHLKPNIPLVMYSFCRPSHFKCIYRIELQISIQRKWQYYPYVKATSDLKLGQISNDYSYIQFERHV